VLTTQSNPQSGPSNSNQLQKSSSTPTDSAPQLPTTPQPTPLGIGSKPPKSGGKVPSFARNLLTGSLRVGRSKAQPSRTPLTSGAGFEARSNGSAGGLERAVGIGAGGNVGPRGKGYCQTDEMSVRSSACSFLVKYLGSCEVLESRGIHICESALQQLRTRKQFTKALLYVSGDAIRVVDQGNSRGLIVDQTIEKVSFCAPDRHNARGFAYICREGTTRRWMCHGFQSVKESVGWLSEVF